VDYVPDNLQTRMLCGVPEPFGEMTEDHLRMAIANLKRLRLVGLAERFDEFLVLLERRLGYQVVRYQAMRVNPTRPRADEVPSELRVAAQQANELDARLYDHATRLFEGYPELADPTLHIEVEALRRVRLPASHAAATDPPGYFTGDAKAWSWLVAAHEKLILERTARLRAQRAAWELKFKADDARSGAAVQSKLDHVSPRRTMKQDRKKRAQTGQAKRVPRNTAKPAPPQTS
jgi:hypothetical protein